MKDPEHIRLLHRQMTTATWREALAAKARRTVAQDAAAREREAASAALITAAKDWSEHEQA